MQELEFTQSPKGSVHNRLLKEKMQNREESFVDTDKGIELVMSQGKYAYFMTYEMLIDSVDRDGFNCKVLQYTCMTSNVTFKNSYFR